MADATISITIPDQYVAEVRVALQHVMGLGAPATAADFKRFVRSHVKAAVFKYREAQQADISRADPTAD